MGDNRKRAAVLWTGGKDSAMALFEAEREGWDVRCLVTFAPAEPNFLAHPLPFIKLQAQAFGREHHVFTLSAPFDKSYEAALSRLRDHFDIDCVVTGDIAPVNAQPNWIGERARAVGIDAYMPLWGRERKLLLGQLIERGFEVRFSLVKTAFLGKDWAGKKLDRHTLAGLEAISAKNGLDLCGENGEYHTLVTRIPACLDHIVIRAYDVCASNGMAYMQLQKFDRQGAIASR